MPESFFSKFSPPWRHVTTTSTSISTSMIGTVTEQVMLTEEPT